MFRPEDNIPDQDPNPPKLAAENLEKWQQGEAEQIAPPIDDPQLQEREAVKQEATQIRRNLDVKQLRELIIEDALLDPMDTHTPQRRAEINAEIDKLLEDQADYPNTSHPD